MIYTYRSKPSHHLLILCESAEAVEEVGRKGQKGKSSEHLYVCLIRNVIEFEVNHFPEVWEEIGSEHEANYQGDDEEFEISKLKEGYLEFLIRLYMCGYPPWFTMKTTDWEMAEKRVITVFTNDFWNY